MQTRRSYYVILIVVMVSFTFVMLSFKLQSSINQTHAHVSNPTDAIEIIDYSQLYTFNKSTAFFKHFTNLYPKLDWNLYDYHWSHKQNRLLMISMPPQHKQAIFKQLQHDMSSNNVTKLIESRRNHLLYMGPLIDVRHNILYCDIPKVATTKFQTVLYGMYANISSNLNYFAKPARDLLTGKINNESVKHIMHRNSSFIIHKLSKYISIIMDSQWTKFVNVRDPLSRSISAYNEKCRIRKKMCMNHKNEPIPEYNEWLDKLQNLKHEKEKEVQWNKNWTIQRHCGLHKYFCELEIFLPFYDYIIMYDNDDIGSSAKFLMETINNGSMSQFYYNWDSDGNDTMFSSYTSHSGSRSQSQQNDIFRKYFTDKQVLKKAVEIYSADYNFLPFDIPHL
eukprot:116997_1